MKNLILIAAAAAMALSPIAAAPANAASKHKIEKTVQYDHGKRKVVKRTPAVAAKQKPQHRWNKGQHFDRRYAANYRVIDNPRDYRLNAAPHGYQWVQSGNDAVLIAIASGLIGAVIGNALS